MMGMVILQSWGHKELARTGATKQHHQAVPWKLSLFPEGGAKAHICDFPLPSNPGLFSLTKHSVY